MEFAADLSRVSFAEGGSLDFVPSGAREDHTNLLVLRSSYRQPFGTFSGELPGGLQLAEGYGVMEWHDVRGGEARCRRTAAEPQAGRAGWLAAPRAPALLTGGLSASPAGA